MGSVASSVMIVMRSSGSQAQAGMDGVVRPGLEFGVIFDFNGETVWHGGGRDTVKTRNLPQNAGGGKDAQSSIRAPCCGGLETSAERRARAR